MNIYEKLLNIQSELKAPKSQYNSFGKYPFRSLEDILEAVKPFCKKYKTVLILPDAIKDIDGRYYVESTATLINVEEPSERVSVTASAREEETKKGMDGSQITGAASSYARKYALGGLFDLDDTKDADATNTGDKPADKPREKVYDAARDGALPTCEECGHKIGVYKSKNGEPMNPNKWAEASRKKYKKVLCLDCMKKLAEPELPNES